MFLNSPGLSSSSPEFLGVLDKAELPQQQEGWVYRGLSGLKVLPRPEEPASPTVSCELQVNLGWEEPVAEDGS